MGYEIDLGRAGDRPGTMDLTELLATRLLVQGNSGSGKSHLLRRLLVQLSLNRLHLLHQHLLHRLPVQARLRRQRMFLPQLGHWLLVQHCPRLLKLLLSRVRHLHHCTQSLKLLVPQLWDLLAVQQCLHSLLFPMQWCPQSLMQWQVRQHLLTPFLSNPTERPTCQ